MPISHKRGGFEPPFHELPIDVLPSIFEHLSSRRDWYTVTLVSKVFNRLATPFLYRALDSRILTNTFIHPCTTILARPELARYVRHVTETGSIHQGMVTRHPDITTHTLAALALCKSLRSLTWIDECGEDVSDAVLLPLLSVVCSLPHEPLRSLTIRTYGFLGKEVWRYVAALKGLVSVSVWSMRGPPPCTHPEARLGKSLRRLELGVSAYLYPVSELLEQLPLLQELRLKGAPASAIPDILALLPNLHTLDTEFLPVFSSRNPHSRPGVIDEQPSPTHLKHLTVRTNVNPNRTRTSGIGLSMWDWILDDVMPCSGLRTFRLDAYGCSYPSSPISPSYSPNVLGEGISIPQDFLLDMGARHGASLRMFSVTEVQMTLVDIQLACILFERLEVLGCQLASSDVGSIMEAITPARHLHTLKLQVVWHPHNSHYSDYSQISGIATTKNVGKPHTETQLHPASWNWDLVEYLTVEDARRMMRSSALRVLCLGHIRYTVRSSNALPPLAPRDTFSFVCIDGIGVFVYFTVLYFLGNHLLFCLLFYLSQGQWVLKDALSDEQQYGFGDYESGVHWKDKRKPAAPKQVQEGQGDSALNFVVSVSLAEDR